MLAFCVMVNRSFFEKVMDLLSIDLLLVGNFCIVLSFLTLGELSSNILLLLLLLSSIDAGSDYVSLSDFLGGSNKLSFLSCFFSFPGFSLMMNS